MKNFLLGALCAIVMFAVGWTLSGRVGDLGLKRIATEKVDSIPLPYDNPQLSVNKVLSTEFCTTADILKTHEEITWALTNIEEFKNLPVEAIQNVATILLRNQKSVTIPTILHEYAINKAIYDNIESIKEPLPQESNTTPDTTSNVKAPSDSKPVAEQKSQNSSSQDSTTNK